MANAHVELSKQLRLERRIFSKVGLMQFLLPR